MYSFGKEVRDLKEAEGIFIEKIENGEFDNFLEKAKIDKDFLTNNVECSECFVLGIDDDFDLNDLFDPTIHQDIIKEIRNREAYRNNSLIIGDFAISKDDTGESVIGYFVSSEAFSYSNNGKILLLALGLILHDEDGAPTSTKEFVIMK
jgi:hypothetical protein